MYSPLSHPRSRAAFTLLEICVAVALSILLAGAIISSMVQSMGYAASSRLMSNARAIVQRNIDAASGVAFTSESGVPPILGLTNGSWTQCEDDGSCTGGGTAENILLSGSSNAANVIGTLSRMVTKETVAESSSAVVYRISFKVDYTFMGKNFTYSESTLRSIDIN